MKLKNSEKSENTEEVEQRIQDKIKNQVDVDFSGGEKKLYRDVLNFWILYSNLLRGMSQKQLRESFDSIKPVPHYQEGYVEKGERDIIAVREDSGEYEA